MPSVNNSPSRQSAMLTAQRYALQEPLFLDTETTGLGPRDEIVEVALLDRHGEVLMDTLVRPTCPIPADAIRIHGINNDMVSTAPSWTQVWEQLDQLLAGRVLGIYNADFDLKMIQQSHAAHRLLFQPPWQETFCIMKQYAQFRGERSRYGGFRWQSLEAAGRQCGLGLSNAHRAMADTQLARAVFYHMVGDLDH